MLKTRSLLLKALGVIAIPAALLMGGCSAGSEDSQGKDVTSPGEGVEPPANSLQGSDEKPVGVTRSGDGSAPDVFDGNIEKAGCWVTLDYCRDPNRLGYPSCHQNGGCTLDKAKSVCLDLIGDYGCRPNGTWTYYWLLDYRWGKVW
jgi:hypothetical protein